MKKLSKYTALTLLCLFFITFISCELLEKRNVEITLQPGQSVEIETIFPRVAETNLKNFVSDNLSVVVVGKTKIETLRPGKTKIHNGKCVAEITVEPYEGPAPYTLPETVVPKISKEKLQKIMGKYGPGVERSEYYSYTFCRILTYDNYPGTYRISFYFDERLGYSDETLELVFITIEPKCSVSTTLAYLLTNCNLGPVSSNGAVSVLGGNRYLEFSDGWLIKSGSKSSWDIVKYCAPGYDFV